MESDHDISKTLRPAERAVRRLTGVTDAQIRQLADVLIDCVEGGVIVASVQLVLAQPENQPHRAEVSKMLVMRRARRRGLGEALLPQGGLCDTTVFYRQLTTE